MPIDMSALIKRLREAKQAEADAERAEAGAQTVVVEQPEMVQQQEGGEPVDDEEADDDEEMEGEADRVDLEPHSEGKSYHWEEKEKEAIEEADTGEEVEDVDIKYPLVPDDPGPDDTVFAWAHIRYRPDEEDVVYELHEPDLSDRMLEVLDQVEERLKESLDVDFGSMKREEAKEYLQQKISRMLSGKEFRLSQEEQEIIEYYAFRNFVGLGKIEPLMKDKYVEDISCDGHGIPVYVYHRNPKVGSVATDVVFDGEEELDAFVRKLAQRCGRSVSMAEPLVDGSLPDGSRVQATLGTDIARRGSNFTIRRFTEDPLTPVDIMEFGTVDAAMLAYLWMAIENGKSMLIAGPTAAGKTSLLNALSLFIPPGLKIVSIEDTPELRLPHPNWVPEVARSGFGFGETESGEVTLDDLLKESLRQRPDYIIVGEVRGEEAYILFQQIATGHPGMSTIHASSLDKVMDRLTTRPINLPGSLIENLDLIVFIKRVRRRGQYVRRVEAVYELEGFDEDREEPIVNKLFEWDAAADSFDIVSDSSVLAQIADDRGVQPGTMQTEIARRKQVVQWMADRDITHYTEVGQVASNYYRNPERLLERIEDEV